MVKRDVHWICAFVLCFFLHNSHSQEWSTNGLYGQTGIVFSPVAYVEQDRRLTFGWQRIPAEQVHLSYSQEHEVGENVYSARLGFLPWMEAGIRLVHPNQAKYNYGIGDRSVFAKVRVLSEREKRPAVAIGVSDPFGTQLLPATYIVASKSLEVMRTRKLAFTGGYGFRFFGEKNYMLENFWTGVQFLPRPVPESHWLQWSAGLEYHQQQVHMTASLYAFSFLQVNIYLLDARDFGMGLSASIML